MPTIEVTSPPLTASTRLRVATRLTDWLAAHGARADHVVVVYRPAEPMTYFAGGSPLSMYQEQDNQPKGAGRARWASVICHIHPNRDRAYQQALADEIRSALGLAEVPGHCLVRCQPFAPERTFYADDTRMVNAAGPQTSQKGNDHATD
jgi:hypothetical protein